MHRLAAPVCLTVLMCLGLACSSGDAHNHAAADASAQDAEPSVRSCGRHLLECDGDCIDPRSDSQHCGNCDHVCKDGQRCAASECVVTCPEALLECDDRCVDTKTDANHCGGCGNSCAADTTCQDGHCRLECVGGTTACDDVCVDLRYDPQHCGSCDNRCENGGVCSAGGCSQQCDGGRSLCTGQCRNLALDVANCGTCGHACGANEVCSNGQCGTSCANSIRCDATCVDPLNDATHCGGCNKQCASGQTCLDGSCGLHCELTKAMECGGKCVKLASDSANCGSCGHACGAGMNCVDAVCACANNTSLCGSSCVDTANDAANCGACGAACLVNEVCAGGGCKCADFAKRCGQVCVDTRVSSANCGECSAPCALGKVCTDGTCATPTSDWPTLGYDLAHSGENQAETGKPPLSLAWSRTLGTGMIHPPVIWAGRLFVTGESYFATSAPLYVLNLSDGTDVWSYNFGSVSSIGYPSVFSNTVYLANGKPTSGTAYLWAFDVATGMSNWGAALSSQWEHYWAPLRVNDIVYTNGGTYGGLYGIAAADGSQRFFQSLEQQDSWSPAYFSGQLFTCVSGHFRKHNLQDGTALSNVQLNANGNISTTTTLVFGPSLAYLIAPPNLVAIDPTQGSTVWTANGTFSGLPAVAGGSVFAISAGNLVARNAQSGALEWTFIGDMALSGAPVIANGIVYTSSAANLYAVDVATHQQVDHQAIGGGLIVGGRRLIVAGAGGKLTAYTLSP